MSRGMDMSGGEKWKGGRIGRMSWQDNETAARRGWASLQSFLAECLAWRRERVLVVSGNTDNKH